MSFRASFASWRRASAFAMPTAAVVAGAFRSPTACDENENAQIVVLGSGSSTGCPKPLCTMLYARMRRGETDPDLERWRTKCKVSNMAIHAHRDPRHNKDYRNNPALLLRQYDDESGEMKNVLIDAGKTFREGALRWFPEHGIKTLDGIVLTHHHMDAVGGLDDVRGFQRFVPAAQKTQPPTRVPIPVYLSKLCHHHLSHQFPWIVGPGGGTHSQSGDGENDDKKVVKRDVAKLDANIFENYKPFTVHGIEVTPLPVWHGADLICHGFAFTLRNRDGTSLNVVYLSDISRMIPETLEFIQKKLPQPTDLLIVDSLLWHDPHPVHFCLDEAVELSEQIKPRKQTLLLGMSCDAFLPHDEMNAHLKEKYGMSTEYPDTPAVQMSHDGMGVNV